MPPPEVQGYQGDGVVRPCGIPCDPEAGLCSLSPGHMGGHSPQAAETFLVGRSHFPGSRKVHALIGDETPREVYYASCARKLDPESIRRLSRADLPSFYLCTVCFPGGSPR